jgi:hypothetical protein
LITQTVDFSAEGLMAMRWWMAILAGLLLGNSDAGAQTADKPASEKSRPEAKLVLEASVSTTLEQVPSFGKFEEGGETRFRHPSGQVVICSSERPSGLKDVPKLKSKSPLFGSIRIGLRARAPGQRFFVLDESGETPPANNEADGKKADGGGLENLTYDRLYFDRNGDGDLTNDGVLEPVKTPLMEGVREYGVQTFADVILEIGGGPDAAKQSVALVPRFRIAGRDFSILELVPRFARQGTIRLGDQQFMVRLNQSRVITGGYDRPMVNVEFTPRDGSSARIAETLSGSLGTTCLIDDQIVRFSATAAGDRFTVEPYRGECGVLEVSAGGRAITKLGVGGTLVSSTGPVSLGPGGSRQIDTLRRQVKLPVGDYGIGSLTVLHGRLLFTCRAAPLTRGQAEGREQLSSPIKIRKDQPYRLEFSGKPEVMLTTGARSSAASKLGGPFKLGQSVRISAMLAEPTQGIMITGLWDVTNKVGEQTFRRDGCEVTIPEYARLDPMVAIYNAKGDKIVEGKMPFG